MILELDFELLTDACFSAANHTLGEPETHHHIPGRTLWGALANLAYRNKDFTAEEAFRLFQQGAVRVLDAVPASGDQRAYPTPFSWHQPKNEPGGAFQNFAMKSVREEFKAKQYKALKGGWTTANLQLLEIKPEYSLRTSVDASGKARDGLLYGLPLLRKGTRFWGALVGAEMDVNRIFALIPNGELRLGRSKNSELGLVHVRKRGTAIASLAPSKGRVDRVSFLCASRCVFRDPLTGSSTFTPGPGAFGLPESWRFDAQSSFVSSARVVHFNSKRGRPESERFALERGSVLTFFTDGEKVALEELSSKLQSGVGEHRGQGYGEVIVSPTWLTDVDPIICKHPAMPKDKVATPPDDELFRWVSGRAEQKEKAISMYEQAVREAGGLRKYGVPASQWGVLRRWAREARFQPARAARLWDEVFHEESGYVTTGKRKLSEHWERAAPALERVCRERRSQAELPIFLELLAGCCMRPDGDKKGEGR